MSLLYSVGTEQGLNTIENGKILDLGRNWFPQPTEVRLKKIERGQNFP